MKSFVAFMMRLMKWTIRIAVYLAFTAGVVVLMLWLAGKFTAKVPDTMKTIQSKEQTSEEKVVKVRLFRLPLYESAVGTIRSVHETTIASKLLARVVDVNLKAGQTVRAGEVLVRLDDTDLRAKLQQAKAAVESAEAINIQAVNDERRAASLRKSNVVSQQEYEKNQMAVTSSAADLRRAQESVKEMQAMLDWATIKAPMDGIITDKKIDVGDMVTPGQVLVTLFDPKRMQLVATVRESLTHQLKIDQAIDVEIDVLKKHCKGTISEIVPEAQSTSRSFQVKVTGPCAPGIYSGMFGRIMIPLQEEDVLVIPRQAVRNVGQLELVNVVVNNRATLRAIRTGRPIGNDVEVLSGLIEGENITVPTGSEAIRETNNE